jgi:hypothetical protein
MPVVPVARPAPESATVAMVADRIAHGAILHDPDGCYTLSASVRATGWWSDATRTDPCTSAGTGS